MDTKMDFLRSRTTSQRLTITGSPVSKVVFLRSVPAETVDVDDEKSSEGKDGDLDDEDDSSEGEDEDIGDEDESSEGEDEDIGDEYEDSEGKNEKYIDEDADVLSRKPALFPCTIRYMDLTCLELQYFDRVPQVLLIRDEWDAVVDIFNKRKTGRQGSAVLTGQPGIG
jgi:hypothetical protein